MVFPGGYAKKTIVNSSLLNRMGHQLSRESDQMLMEPDTGTIYLRVDLEDPRHPEPCTNAKHRTCVRFVDEIPVTQRKQSYAQQQIHVGIGYVPQEIWPSAFTENTCLTCSDFSYVLFLFVLYNLKSKNNYVLGSVLS